MNDLISRKALIDSIKKSYCTNCNNHNGVRCRACEYDDAIGLVEDAPAVNPLPCKMGDVVWAIRNYRGKLHPMQGFVSEMFYLDDMRLAIVVKHIARGFWGDNIFATYEECAAAIERKGRQ